MFIRHFDNIYLIARNFSFHWLILTLTLWHWLRAHRSWNAIQCFSMVLRKGRVLMRSYKLYFTYCRNSRADRSTCCEKTKNLKQYVKHQKPLTPLACNSFAELKLHHLDFTKIETIIYSSKYHLKSSWHIHYFLSNFKVSLINKLFKQNYLRGRKKEK